MDERSFHDSSSAATALVGSGDRHHTSIASVAASALVACYTLIAALRSSVPSTAAMCSPSLVAWAAFALAAYVWVASVGRAA